MIKLLAIFLMAFLPFTLSSGQLQVVYNQPEAVEEVVIEIQNGMSEYLTAIGTKESNCTYNAVNTYGMLGKYQFSSSTLKGLGFNVSDSTFLNTPSLQEEAMMQLLRHNKKILNRIINKHSGDTINNIQVSESGILAAAHLAGPRNVKKWLKSKGKITRKDAYGTTIEIYMNKFKNYTLEI